MTLQILHGPGLTQHKPPKGRPKARTTWTYGVRLNPEIATLVDNAARAANATPCDVIRTAVYRLLAETQIADASSSSLTEPAAPSTISAPRLKPAYTGKGGSDFNATRHLQANSAADKLRKSQAQAHGKLSDHTPVR